MTEPPPPSRSQIRKAGSTIRRHARGEAPAEEFASALDVVRRYRASFAKPLSEVTDELRRIVGSLNIKAEISQRLKRMDTIIDKLSQRETGLSLDRMVDLGGCRVVLDDDSLHDLSRIGEQLKLTWAGDLQANREKDYISEPRASGYRAKHLVLLKDGRLIEIQLRTARMHAWAQTMEALGMLVGQNLKQDQGHSLPQEYGRALSKMYQQIDGSYRMTDQDLVDFQRISEELSFMFEKMFDERRLADGH